MLTTVETHDNINELRVKHGQHKTPWQLNSNATLKILWEISEWRQHLKITNSKESSDSTEKLEFNELSDQNF